MLQRRLKQAARLVHGVYEHPTRIPEFFRSLRSQGFAATRARIRALVSPPPFRPEYVYRETFDPEHVRTDLQKMRFKPRISIIMPTYNVRARWLKRAVESVINQLYENWELCIVDDCSTLRETRAYLKELGDDRIRVRWLEKNVGISGASNEALKLIQGDYVTFLDHDDELTRDALYEVAGVINRNPPDVIYSDEDFLSPDNEYVTAHFKPDYSPDLLLSHNYITHLLVIRRNLIEAVGGFRSPFDGAQDYDLLLRVVDLAKDVVHLPKVLYHWRTLESSTARASSAKGYTVEAGRRALEGFLDRNGIRGEVLNANVPNYYRVRRDILGTPLVSIIIPFKDLPDVLSRCLDTILSISTYENFEILGISNNSEDERTFALMQDFAERDSRIHFHQYNVPFSFADINNFGVSLARGQHVLLMNNDIEVLTPDWIQALLEHSQRPDVGAVGAKLYYCSDTREHADRTIQHAGVVLGICGFAGHSHRHFAKDAPGYFNRLNVIQNFSAVTAALLMVKKSLYESVGGLDHEHFAIGLNDVDFCLRLREKGYLNVFTPYCEANHLESASRGYENTPTARTRFEREIANFQSRHRALLKGGDPFYNPNLTLDAEDFGLNSPHFLHMP